MKAFANVGDEMFVADASAYLVAQHGRKKVTLPTSALEIRSLPPEQLQDMVRIGIHRARFFGLASRSALISYLVTMFLTAPNFDENPIVRSILKDWSIVPDRRMDELWKRTSDPDWVAVRRSLNPKAWEEFPEAMANG